MRIVLSDNHVHARSFADPEPVVCPCLKEVVVPYMDDVVERLMRTIEEHYRETGMDVAGIALGVKAYLSAAAFVIARELRRSGSNPDPDNVVMTAPRSGFEFNGIKVCLGTGLGPNEIVALGDGERVGELLKHWGYA